MAARGTAFLFYGGTESSNPLSSSGESAANLVIGKDRTFCRFPRKNPYEGFPENARWNAERQAVEFGVEIGEYRGVVRVPRRVFQRLLPERPTGSAVR
jgi:hypothetical protein